MNGWPDTRFTALVGCTHPIALAPMAGAGGVELCVAAMEGGALGSLPCGMLGPERVSEQAAEVRARVSGPLNLNFFCHQMPQAADEAAWRNLLLPYRREFGAGAEGGGALRLPFDEAMCDAAVSIGPEVVSFHFGLPEERLLARLKSAGAVVVGNATTVAEALWLAERGADAVIAQGWEAGGHSGRFLGSDPAEAMTLFALVPQVADAVGVPVIAAGGIGDARGIAAALRLGAAAVQIGTAYLHCPESLVSEAHRAALAGQPTLFTNLLTGGLARGVAGRLVRELGAIRDEAPPYPLAADALAPIRAEAEKRGEFGFGPMWAGQAGPLGRALPAAALTRALAAEALALAGGAR
ncbi:MAG TPA: nitronate monooxygenase [Allosphingosinicella sp.]|nr:nitronate monooxygenase [Allosphingosinicella sp.]